MPDEEQPNTVAGRATPEHLAQVAHDLRTPLSVVLLWVRLLRRGAAPDPGAALDAIERSAMEVSRLVDRLSLDAEADGDGRRVKAPEGPCRQRNAKREAARSPRAPSAPSGPQQAGPQQAHPRGSRCR